MAGERHELTTEFDFNQPVHTHVVAEIGNVHEGSLGNVHAYIMAAADAGVDFVKLQYHLADFESTPAEQFPGRFSFHPQDRTRTEYWRRMEIRDEWWPLIDGWCQAAGVRLMVSPFSTEAVDRLERFNLDSFSHYKIASGELFHTALLGRIKDTGRPVVLSTGMADQDEYTNAAAQLLPVTNEEFDHDYLTVLQCTTRYPTPAEWVGMNITHTHCRNICYRGGISDHSGTIWPGVVAAYLGAYMVEVHVCWDRRQFGVDVSSSLTMRQLRRLVDGVRFAETMRTNPVRKDAIKQMLPDVAAYTYGKKREAYDPYRRCTG